MKNSRFNSLPQLAAVMAAFSVTIVLLESQALLTWANRLDIGTSRKQAVQITTALHNALAPLGIEDLRRQALVSLDRLGWTDDPARLQAAQNMASLALRCNAITAATHQPLHSGPPLNSPSAPLRGLAASPVSAVPATTPLPPLPPVISSKPRTVALVGDSMMAVGLSNVLLRGTATNQTLHVIRAFKSGTGLARPDVFDWMQEYPAMIGDQQPDVIFVAIGANDGQGFVENGEVLPFGTDVWVKVYQQRTAAFLNLLTQHGARVVWVGLPPMKSAQYDSKVKLVNRIAYTVVSQYPQAVWWNPQSFITEPNGDYREFASVANGKTERIRAADGIHLSDDGAALLAPTLLGWLSPAPPITNAQAVPPTAPESKVSRRRSHHRPVG